MLVRIADDRIAVIFDVAPGIFLRTVHQIGVPILFSQPVCEAVAVIVGSRAVLIDDRKLIAEYILDVLGIVPGILAALFVTDGLDLRIHRRVDLKTAAVKERICFVFCLSRVFLQVLEDLGLQRVHKVGVDAVVFHLLFDIDFLDPCVDVVALGLIELLLIDISLIEHILQNDVASLSVLLGVDDRIKLRGVLRNTGYNGAFRDRQLIAGFVKISLRSCFYAERAMSEVDRVEIVEQDRILAHRFLQLDRTVLLLQFSLDPLHLCLIGPVGEDIVLDQLLGNGTGALREVAGGQSDHRCTKNPRGIDAVVLIKPLILDRHKGMCQIIRDHITGYGDSVGIR